MPEIAVITMLVWALMPFNPYGYYMLLRCVVFAYAGYTLYQMRNTKSWIWFITLASIALLYNPIYRIRFAREVWVVINLVTIVVVGWFWHQRSKNSPLPSGLADSRQNHR